MKFRSAFIATACAALVQILPGVAWADTPERLAAAVATLNDLSKSADSEIPADLLKKASCIVVIPSLKSGAFVVGADYGRGFASCRSASGWTAPAAVKVEAGSVGFQIGGSESEVVMLVMNEKGMDRLLSTKFTLGGDATVAAGPVGRNAQAKTDASMRAEILSVLPQPGRVRRRGARRRNAARGRQRQPGSLRQGHDEPRDLDRRRARRLRARRHFSLQSRPSRHPRQKQQARSPGLLSLLRPDSHQ